MMANDQRSKKPSSRFIFSFKRFNFGDAFNKEIYRIFHRYILRPKFSKMWGFPYIDSDGKVKYCSNQFSKRQKSNIVKCRCGKEIALINKNWFVDEYGCEYHPGKIVYSENKNTDIFTCCSKTMSSSGCVRKNHHVSAIRVCHEDNFVKTFQKKHCCLPCLPNIFALDCEMVYTTKGMEVVKVTVLTVFCDVVYDTFVKPRNPVIDYNTEFSGIDETHLHNVTVDLNQVQADLLNLFDTETILIGHGLENDLICLNLYHSKVIDTSILFAHSKGYPWRHSLKTLAETYLNKQIHCSKKGHDSQEDAKTCIELIARKIFVSSRKDVMLHSPRTGVPVPNFQNKTNGFRHPLPPPMNWNLQHFGYAPPPYQHSNYFQNPLLLYPMQQNKFKFVAKEQDKKPYMLQ